MTCSVSLSAEAKTPPKLLVQTDFENSSAQGLYQTLVRHRYLDVVDKKGVGDSKALRAKYEGYDRGSQRIVTRHALPEKISEATLAYDVMFDKDFQFVKGGKMHGLGPDHSITGGKSMTPDGWSARIMWHARGLLNSYVYSQNKRGQYGEQARLRRPCYLKKGRYYAISIYVKVNDPVGAANGRMLVFVNGKLAVRHEGIQYRKVGGDQTLISHVLFSTFHGGHSPDWAPKDRRGGFATVYAYYDNFAVFKGAHVRKKPGMDKDAQDD